MIGSEQSDVLDRLITTMGTSRVFEISTVPNEMYAAFVEARPLALNSITDGNIDASANKPGKRRVRVTLLRRAPKSLMTSLSYDGLQSGRLNAASDPNLLRVCAGGTHVLH
jgi:hypothetical protein